jgi:uncharacterized protein
MYRRNVDARLRAALADTPVVLLNGARQTGKSTLAHQLSADLGGLYVTLDDATVLAGAVADPVGFLNNLEGFVVIDEVQKASGLFPAIKKQVDGERRPGRYLLTGSANVLLLPRLSESLAGRMEIVTLWPLSQGELAGRREGFISGLFSSRMSHRVRAAPEDRQLAAKIATGGYPEAVARDEEPRRQAWFGSYITAILQRDVRDLANIEGLTEMPRLLALLAARTSGLMNTAELSRASTIPQSTLKRYLTLFETTYLLQPLPAWTANIGKRLIKSPKIHLVDCGLASHLTGQTEKRIVNDPVMLGPLLESFVVMELRKQASWSDVRVSIHHFRSAAGREVDIVLEDSSGQIVGVEVKAAGSVAKKDFAGLEALAEAAGKKFLRGVVLYSGDSVVPFGPKYQALPVGSLWRMA